MSRVILSALSAKLGDYSFNPYHDDGEYNFECPKCQTGKKKLGVNLKKQVFHCFRCSWSGRLRGLLKFLEIEPLADVPSGPVNRAADGVDGPALKLPAEIPGFIPLRAAGASHGKTEEDAFYYCKKRGLEPYDVEELGLGLSEDPYLTGRLIIPVREDGITVNYVARSLYPWIGPKDKTGPEWQGWAPKGSIAYGLDLVQSGKNVVLVEGFWDWWKVSNVSRMWNTVALLGSSLTPVVCGRLLARRPGRVILFLDGDTPGEEATYASVIKLFDRRHTAVFVARPPAGKDPDELESPVIAQLVNDAKPATMWILER